MFVSNFWLVLFFKCSSFIFQSLKFLSVFSSWLEINTVMCCFCPGLICDGSVMGRGWFNKLEIPQMKASGKVKDHECTPMNQSYLFIYIGIIKKEKQWGEICKTNVRRGGCQILHFYYNLFMYIFFFVFHLQEFYMISYIMIQYTTRYINQWSTKIHYDRLQ